MRGQEEAMRIMEALLGVDEELLARCESAGSGADTVNTRINTAGAPEEAARCTGKKGWQNGYMWRYLSRCAAVLALVAVGAVSWRGFRMTKDAANDESASGGSPEAFAVEYELSLKSEGNPIENNIQGGDKEMLPMPTAAGTGLNAAGGMDSQDVLKASGGSDIVDWSNGSGETDGLNGMDDIDIAEKLEKEDCLVSASRMLTIEEARQIKLLGDYVPTALPADYVFDTARYEAEKGGLTICWSRGMDDIMLCFKQVDGAAAETVDIQKPEAYDERLYEIPFADTVPEEYRETFYDPVFAKDDFSLEIVRSRVLSYNGDGGDTSTPRGHFSVLYDSVLVYFNGRGTPEEIWEMFASISE